MHPSVHAAACPDKPAVVMAGTGAVETFGELEARSNQGAHLFRALGLAPGETVALLLENHPRYFDLAWAAQRSGLFYVAISSRLTLSEAAHILQDSGARALVTSPGLADVAQAAAQEAGGDIALFMTEDARAPFRDWAAETASLPTTPVKDERAGSDMLYSSGTTGRPKGVRPRLPDPSLLSPNPLTAVAGAFGFGQETVYLSPAPLYHAAPLRWSMTTHRLGGTVVVMEKFDPEAALAAIERFGVTHSQWVPTHFVRLLKLPQEARTRHDLSSLKIAIHAAAPCPVPVKQAMIDWWGPKLVEYYAGTEGNGMTLITSPQWLAHPGSVGPAVLGTVRICGDDGEPLPARAEGGVYFEGGPDFAYHNDPEKTASARNARGWSTLGDIGWLDEEGYLYLTDRKSFMIISGGVNVYPQEIENLLVTHPAVADAAVIGAPDADLGERVVAVVQPLDPAADEEALRVELTAWMRERLSGVKLPRKIDFMAELPRHPTGKLYKRLLRDAYWAKATPTA